MLDANSLLKLCMYIVNCYAHNNRWKYDIIWGELVAAKRLLPVI